MNLIFAPAKLRIMAAVMLTFLLFVFVHSELDQFSHHEDTHETHDFCQLMDGAKTSFSAIGLMVQDKFIVDTDACLCHQYRRAEAAHAAMLPFPDSIPKLHQSIDNFLFCNILLI